ncbi:MAG: transposase [Rikenellaceae bacterium]
MEETINKQYVKRTQRDYTMSFKLAIVQEVESGSISVTAATKKYGIQGKSTILNWVIGISA